MRIMTYRETYLAAVFIVDIAIMKPTIPMPNEIQIW